MKKIFKILVIFTILLTVTSCGDSDPRNEILKTYVETTWMKGTRLDLNLEVLELTDIGDVTGLDSANYLAEYFDNVYDSNTFKSVTTIDSVILTLENLVSVFTELEKKDYDVRMKTREILKKKGITYSTESSMIRTYSGWIERLNVIKQYKSDKDELLGKLVRTKFTMTNPLLKVKQEMNRTYLFSPSGDKVLELVSSE